ncbi:Glycosyl transferase family 2 [Bizionia echini]|uniref:Glycosyl transferase family 2 n=1 Tax=Bizionia echini TaxID=649333 RepID=A0A1I5BCH0_9FLAO|nr:glycosyltransferase family 2 protein [Bizionia echini]SFN72340.1 Glycosyl transferase family 2 [Bizionia echini]
MKLSVVIPVYNGADFIEKSYHAILNQHLEDFEILYVDNNSQDASVIQINRLVVLDSRVKLLIQSKQGAAAARNMGIQQAKGDYVYVFDVDDDIYPNALQKMVTVLDTHPSVDAVFGKMVKSYQSISNTTKPKDETHDVIIKEKPYWGLQWFSSLKSVVGPPAFLYRKTVFDRIGLYNEAIRNNEDTALDIKLGMTSHVAFLDSYVYLYYKHEDSTIEQSKRKMPRAFMVWPRLVQEHLPFFLEQDTPIKFKSLLFSQLFQSMGRQLVFTKGLHQRQDLKKQLYFDLQAIQIPLVIRLYLSILVILPYEFLRKIYGYYVVPYAVKQLLN